VPAAAADALGILRQQDACHTFLLIYLLFINYLVPVAAACGRRPAAA